MVDNYIHQKLKNLNKYELRDLANEIDRLIQIDEVNAEKVATYRMKELFYACKNPLFNKTEGRMQFIKENIELFILQGFKANSLIS